MAAPTFVADYEGTRGWDSTLVTPQATPTFDALTGDVLVSLLADDDDAGNENWTWTNTGGAQTWTENPETTGATNNDVLCQSATAICSSAITTGAVSVAFTGASGRWNHTVGHFRDSSGIGAVDRKLTSGSTPSWTFTTLYNDSAIMMIIGDWSAANGDVTRTWKTINGYTPTAGNGQELTYFRNSAQYSVFCAYWPNVGLAGAKTIGMDAPLGSDSMYAVVEIRGIEAPTDPGYGQILLEDGSGSIEMEGVTDLLLLDTNDPDPVARARAIFNSNPALGRSYTR